MLKKQQKLYREKNSEKIHNCKKQHYESHKEQILEQNKKYQEEHKEAILAKQKIYVEENMEQIKINKHEWYQKNKEQILQKQKQMIMCECGSEIRKAGKAEHCNSTKHQKYVQLNIVNPLPPTHF